MILINNIYASINAINTWFTLCSIVNDAASNEILSSLSSLNVADNIDWLIFSCFEDDDIDDICDSVGGKRLRNWVDSLIILSSSSLSSFSLSSSSLLSTWNVMKSDENTSLSKI